jgi:hypothetical protein
MSNQYLEPISQLIDLQHKISHLHPLLGKPFPIAIAQGDQLFIYEPDPSGERYHFSKEAALSTPIPEGVRAAFPLESLNNRIACVVTGDVFDTLDGFVTIFHEFIHCQQFETCETKLKGRLGIARKAQAAQEFMWELDHPFPYQSFEFSSLYQSFLDQTNLKDFDEVIYLRKQLKEILNREDYEYLLWEEWKEGLARWIENKIRQNLGLHENHNGQEKPFSRVSFYEGGARFIERLELFEPGISFEIENLFQFMLLEDEH